MTLTTEDVGRQEAVAQGERGPKAVPGPSIELIPSTGESQGADSETHDTREERASEWTSDAWAAVVIPHRTVIDEEGL